MWYGQEVTLHGVWSIADGMNALVDGYCLYYLYLKSRVTQPPDASPLKLFDSN